MGSVSTVSISAVGFWRSKVIVSLHITGFVAKAIETG